MTTFAMLLVPEMTQLDFTGPYEVFARCPQAQIQLVWKTRELVRTELGLSIQSTATLDEVSSADVLFVPGGRGINRLLNDEAVTAWAARVARSARYVTATCTGALVLGAAGLLRGKRATTHWTAREMLPELGAVRTDERVVKDGNVITGGGVTAGIDFALTVAAEMYGPDVAQTIQLNIEYDPAPPFNSGHPDTARAEITEAFLERIAPRQAERWAAVRQAAQRLGTGWAQ